MANGYSGVLKRYLTLVELSREPNKATSTICTISAPKASGISTSDCRVVYQLSSCPVSSTTLSERKKDETSNTWRSLENRTLLCDYQRPASLRRVHYLGLHRNITCWPRPVHMNSVKVSEFRYKTVIRSW